MKKPRPTHFIIGAFSTYNICRYITPATAAVTGPPLSYNAKGGELALLPVPFGLPLGGGEAGTTSPSPLCAFKRSTETLSTLPPCGKLSAAIRGYLSWHSKARHPHGCKSICALHRRRGAQLHHFWPPCGPIYHG
jgi:hypothetical protein